MRRTVRMVGVIGAMGLLAMPLAAQHGPGHGAGRGMMRGGPGLMARNPAAVVLDHRDALELTADQVTRIEAIRDRVEAENAPRRERLLEAIGDVVPSELTIRERMELRERMQELRPVREEMRATNRAAGEEIHELLTEDQEKELVAIMHADRPGRGARGMRGRRGPRGPRGGGTGGGR